MLDSTEITSGWDKIAHLVILLVFPYIRQRAPEPVWHLRTVIRKYRLREFPGGPVVRPPRFHCRGPGFDPCRGTKITQAPWRSQKKGRKEGRMEGRKKERKKMQIQKEASGPSFLFNLILEPRKGRC